MTVQKNEKVTIEPSLSSVEDVKRYKDKLNEIIEMTDFIRESPDKTIVNLCVGLRLDSKDTPYIEIKAIVLDKSFLTNLSLFEAEMYLAEMSTVLSMYLTQMNVEEQIPDPMIALIEVSLLNSISMSIVGNRAHNNEINRGLITVLSSKRHVMSMALAEEDGAIPEKHDKN